VRRWNPCLEAYRERRMTGYQLRTLLGIPSRYKLDRFLKEHRWRSTPPRILSATLPRSGIWTKREILNARCDSPLLTLRDNL
jgi:hypothetical protein